MEGKPYKFCYDPTCPNCHQEKGVAIETTGDALKIIQNTKKLMGLDTPASQEKGEKCGDWKCPKNHNHLGVHWEEETAPQECNCGMASKVLGGCKVHSQECECNICKIGGICSKECTRITPAPQETKCTAPENCTGSDHCSAEEHLSKPHIGACFCPTPKNESWSEEFDLRFKNNWHTDIFFWKSDIKDFISKVESQARHSTIKQVIEMVEKGVPYMFPATQERFIADLKTLLLNEEGE